MQRRKEKIMKIFNFLKKMEIKSDTLDFYDGGKATRKITCYLSGYNSKTARKERENAEYLIKIIKEKGREDSIVAKFLGILEYEIQSIENEKKARENEEKEREVEIAKMAKRIVSVKVMKGGNGSESILFNLEDKEK